MFDLISIVKVAGYVGIGAAVFAESGVLIGLILPGDSLLFTAGLVASQGYLHIVPLCLIALAAAVSGDSVGYWFGKRFGRSMFSRRGSFLLDPAHIGRAERFFDRYGSRTIFLARFIPIVRTLAPLLAGIGNMRYRTFLAYNVVGGIVWAVGVTLTGYWLGATVPNIDHYLLPIIGVIVLSSLLPGMWEFLRTPEDRQKVMARIRSILS